MRRPSQRHAEQNCLVQRRGIDARQQRTAMIKVTIAPPGTAGGRGLHICGHLQKALIEHITFTSGTASTPDIVLISLVSGAESQSYTLRMTANVYRVLSLLRRRRKDARALATTK
jgi:hypothetical protein